MYNVCIYNVCNAYLWSQKFLQRIQICIIEGYVIRHVVVVH